MMMPRVASRGQRFCDRHDVGKSLLELDVEEQHDDLPFIRLQRDELPTPTTTVKNEPTCPCWDLHSAASSEGGGEAIRRFIMSGGDPGAEQWGNSPLHVAAYGGRSEAVRIALNHGADVEQRNRARETALHLACRGAHSDVVRLLLESAADPMSQDICGRTPAEVVSGDHESSGDIKELLKKSDELRELGALKRRVHIQVCHDSTQAVEKLLSVGGSVDIRDAAQRTLLHRACEEASVDMVAKLLTLGATVDAIEKRSQTPLHRACERGRLDVVRLLIEQGGANPRAVAKQQHEPLHVACLGNWGALVTYLLEKGGADVEIADKNGKRPLHLAVEANKLESIRALLTYGEDSKGLLHFYSTILQVIQCRVQADFIHSTWPPRKEDLGSWRYDYSAYIHYELGRPRVPFSRRQILIGRNADIRAKDSRGHTPLQSTNNRRCRDRLREAERREEAAAAKKRVQAEQHRRALASKRREEEVLGRVSLRSRAWAPS